MTTIFVVNNETRLLLIPSNEAERLLLAQLMDGEVEMHHVSDKVNILGQTITGGVVIQKKNMDFRSAREETVITDSLRLDV